MSHHNITIRSSSAADGKLSSYGYVPNEGAVIFFLVLFGISTAIHLVQALYFRLWFLLPTVVLCGLGELAGWSGRLWSSYNVLSDTAYTIQITATIISPTPLIAASFIMLGRIVARLGQRYSRLSQKRYNRVFLSCDILALLVQAGGASVASGTDISPTQLKIGTYTILGGIAFQLLCLIIYCLLAAEFLWRYQNNIPVRAQPAPALRPQTPRRLKKMLIGMAVMAAFLFVRSVYRTVELADGWTGPIIRTEWPFDLLDGLAIVCAMFTLNVLHPGMYLLPEESTAEAGEVLFEPKPQSLEESA